MPIVRNSSGHSRYISVDELFYSERPEDFFRNKSDELTKRLDEARYRVIEVIRFAETPLSGRGTCHEVRGIGSSYEDLANFVDERDGRRATLLKRQRSRKPVPGEYRRRSPQNIARRRSALFRGDDIPAGYFRTKYACHVGRQERERFVDLMRWYLLESAIQMMHALSEIEHINDRWYLKVSVTDAHPTARRERKRKSEQSSHRVKQDDRSFHGRPNRDRTRIAS